MTTSIVTNNIPSSFQQDVESIIVSKGEQKVFLQQFAEVLNLCVKCKWYWIGNDKSTKIKLLDAMKCLRLFDSVNNFMYSTKGYRCEIYFAETANIGERDLFYKVISFNKINSGDIPLSPVEFLKKQKTDRLNYLKELIDGFTKVPSNRFVQCFICGETQTYRAYHNQSNQINCCGCCYDTIKPEKKINVEISEKDYQEFLKFKNNNSGDKN